VIAEAEESLQMDKSVDSSVVPVYSTNLPATFFSKKSYLYIIMTKAELKLEIQKVLDNVPENVLQDILSLLKGLQGKSADIARIHTLRQILAEDKDLLERLAK
jgi:hypothetical protein